jgi:hypothetical protein
MRPDKKSITDEIWDDERVRSFLAPQPRQGGDAADFTLLLNAYRGMRPDDFSRFIGFFCQDGHDLDARNEAGQTLIDFILPHRHAKPFIDVMVVAGARPSDA